MIVAIENDDAAMLVRADVVAVFERIAGTIHTGTLAVPRSEHPVIEWIGHCVDLLCAPHSRGSHVFVYSGDKRDIRRRQALLDRPESIVYIAERRAAISRDVARRAQPSLLIEGFLREQDTGDRLCPVDHDAPFLDQPFVVEADIGNGGGD